MSLTCRVLSSEGEGLDEDLWSALIQGSPNGSIFHTTEWLEAIRENYRLPLTRWIVLDANGKPQGGAYLFERQKGGLKLAYAPPSDAATPYGGLLVVPANSLHTRKQESHLKEVMELLKTQILSEKRSATFLTFPPSMKDIRPMQWSGWEPRVFYTYTVSLGDSALASEVFGKLDSTARNTIRKAEKAVQVHEESNIEAFYSLYEDTYKRQGKTVPVPKPFLLDIVKRFQEKGWAKLLMAYTPEGNPAAGAVWLRDERHSYYWLAASHYELARTTGAPALVLWKLFEMSVGEVSEIDLVGANTESIAFFKAMFNPELKPYYGLEYTEVTYRIASVIWRNLAKVRGRK